VTRRKLSDLTGLARPWILAFYTAPKEDVVQRFLCRQPFRGIQRQQLFNERDCRFYTFHLPLKLLFDGLHVRFLWPGKIRERQLVKAGPNLFRRRAAKRANLEVLVQVVGRLDERDAFVAVWPPLMLAVHALWVGVEINPAPQDRPADEELGYNAPSTPNVNRSVVVPEAKQDLWRPVPPGAYGSGVLRVLRVVTPSQTKVSNLQHAIVAQQQVCDFHVPVQDLVLVTVVQTFEHLLADANNLGWFKVNLSVQQAAEIMLHKLKDQGDAALRAINSPTATASTFMANLF